jgi:HK97 family phage prohead protease
MNVAPSIIRRRDQSQTLRRFQAGVKVREVEANGKKRKVLTMVASTSRAVDWGGYREVLVHKADAISRDAAKAMLINHDPNRIGGPITDIRVSGDQMEIDAELLPDARMDSGVTVADAIESGALQGVSIGYHYLEKDTQYDRDTRTLTVNAWRLLEVSLTPIPADDSAGLRSRSLPDHLTQRGAAAPKKDKTPMKKFMQWLAARGYNLDKLTDEQVEHLRQLCDSNQEPADDFAKEARSLPVKADADEAKSAKILAAQREIAARAKSLGLDAADFIGMDDAKANEAMVRKMAERDASPEPQVSVVSVTRDAGDKILSLARASLYSVAGIKAEGDEVKELRGLRPMGMRQLLREIAFAAGYRDAHRWSEVEFAARGHEFIDLRTFGRRDAANKLVANFSTLLANVAQKAVQLGLDNYDGATWQQWCTQRNVNNFLAVTNANLATGRLIETAEDVAFPELTQKDGGYNSTLGLFGATISVSFQAIINDQLGKIMGDLRRAGAIAGLTIDREVYRKLLNATWTNDTSTSAGLSTATNLDKPRAALREKLSPANERLGIVARYLLHDAENAVNAQVATGAIYAPGGTTAPSQGSRQIIPIESQWIGDTSLFGSALTTDYYLTGNPQVHDTVLVNFLEGIGMSPIIMPFDAGAVAAEKYKIMLPFAATVATHTDGAATPATRVSGMQKATAA